MGWNELHILTTSEHALEIENQLQEFGAEAITLRDAGNNPIYEPPLDSTPSCWKEAYLIALFAEDFDLSESQQYLQQQLSTGTIKNFEIKYIADEDWERRCLQDFKPLCFGKRLCICPSWIDETPPDAITIILDPGLAFGTGTHPTTALCLEWLDENIKGNENIIDYGCGSGILGLAALKLGAKEVIAIDHDQRALDVSRTNAERNGISEAQLKIELPSSHRHSDADLVIANILAQPLIELAPLLASFVKPHGKILLSGILTEQAEHVTKIYSEWFMMEPPANQNEWIRLTGERNLRPSSATFKTRT